MGYRETMASWLNFLFDPLLKLEPIWAILIVSILMSLIITLINRYMTDQKKMKQIKDEMKEYQKEMRKLKEDPKKMMAVQKKAMAKNSEYMKMSFKPMLITFIPIIIIFSWLAANLAFLPIAPEEVFSTTIEMYEGVDGEVTLTVPEGLTLLDNATRPITDEIVRWELKGEEGTYTLEYTYKDETVIKDVFITPGYKYETPELQPASKRFKTLRIDNDPVKPLGGLSIFGWRPGWLGTYIIFSLIFGMGLRKLLRVY